MTYSIIAIFKSENEAQRAAQQLHKNGFSQEKVEISHKESPVDNMGHYKKEDKENGFFKFFDILFGEDKHKSSKLYDFTRSMVTVHADSIFEAERAADIMDFNGAVDVDKKIEEYSFPTESRSLQNGANQGEMEVKDNVKKRNKGQRSFIIEKPA